MSAQNPVDALATDFTLAITQMRARLRREQFDTPQSHSMSQLAVLSRISMDQPITASDVAAAEHVRQQSVAETVAGLRKQGLVSAEPDPTDKRKWLLSLTPEGERYVASIQAHRGAWVARAIEETVSGDEQRILAQAVKIIMRLADAKNS